jgi:hypothetical protein
MVGVDIAPILKDFLVRRAVLCEDASDEEPLPDYYAILKLTPDASVKDIRRSFR